MIKYKVLPDDALLGISGMGSVVTYWNSRFFLSISKLLKIKESFFLCYCAWLVSFCLIFVEIYIINSFASGTFALMPKRVVFLFVLTGLFFFFGRKALPYWSETDEEL
ncbi:hypothetical protein HMPREF3144_08860 [Oligella sp. HMSC05A10]|uniref:Uncharacterized protein n=1 Tax=Oligella urethralis DNF00040 TaxID=1401065 RepID=A0A095YSS0_9BURK|nr:MULTISPECIES: hypothetical protein [Oligella]KGF25216.1 hypothetical protein HMPREF2130_11510 [Oligella urethralis DNF00040]OFS83400.1 hypothetical protein HMPREF3144_08860 [Oligella sp. HMSC05A10]